MDVISKLVLSIDIDEKDDILKQIRAIRNFEQLKICDLKYFDQYADLFYKYWSQVGRPFDQDLLLKLPNY